MTRCGQLKPKASNLYYSKLKGISYIKVNFAHKLENLYSKLKFYE